MQAQRMKIHTDAIESVKQKIASGEYPLEPTTCFCGADDDYEIKTEDRLGIPHRIVVCKNCAITRANPRMTQAAYNSYYNDEYRRLTYHNLKTSSDDRETELELIRQHEREGAKHLLLKLGNEDVSMPKVVVDFGCYMGGVLDEFKANGAETWGIECNDEARQHDNDRGHKVVKSIDDLIAAGVKANLVIMQDVVEHLLDLNEVKKIREIMAPDGYLYAFTPGLFRTDPVYYWQLAHTYYFVANTFSWVMNQLGFHETYIDEDVTSFWQARDISETVPEAPKEWADYIIDEASGKEERKLPPFRGVCKFTKKLLYDNMRKNFAMKHPDINAISATKKGAAVIIGGGPSIEHQIETIRELKSRGASIFAIARMYPWCIANGLIPDYVVSLDCSEEQEKGFENIQAETTHLMATVTRPEIIEMIHAKGAPIYIFDSRDDRKIKDLRRDAGYSVATVINAGGTVVVTCMSTAFNIGFTKLHVFGLDLMFPNRTELHAKGIAGQSVPQKILTCTIGGEEILTTPSFLEFAKQALDLTAVAYEEGVLESIKFYGDSIINRLWDGEWHEEEAA